MATQGLTQMDMLKSGYDSGDPARRAAAIAGGYVAPTATTDTTNTKTKAKTFAQPQFTGSDYQNALNEAMGYARSAANTRIDENQIRNDVLNQFQAEIDAQNAIYGDRLRQAQQQGMGRLGSGTAIQARRGLLGSDFGAAQTNQIQAANTDIENEIRNEQAAKVAQIMGLARKASTEAIAEKRKAKEAGLESYLKYLSEGETRKESNASKAAKALMAQGMDLETIRPEDLQTLATGYGISIDAIKNAYASEKQAADAAAAELDLKTRKAEADIGKTTAETEMINKKFEEDKRQFGLEYALKERAQALSESKASDEKAAKAGSPEKVKTSLALTKDALARASTFSGSSGNTGVLGKAGRFLGGADDYTNLVAQANTIRTNVLAMVADPSIKSFFGPQMTEKDVELMTAAATTLNPELQTPDQLVAELERLNVLVNKFENAVQAQSAPADTGGPTSFTLPDGSVVTLQPDGTYK